MYRSLTVTGTISSLNFALLDRPVGLPVALHGEAVLILPGDAGLAFLATSSAVCPIDM